MSRRGLTQCRSTTKFVKVFAQEIDVEFLDGSGPLLGLGLVPRPTEQKGFFNRIVAID